MTARKPEDAPQFELTIAGALGPALRRALRPGAVVASHTCTILRTRSAKDLPELVELLSSHGLQIEGVWVGPPAGDDPTDGPM
jgi:hypothetical protein